MTQHSKHPSRLPKLIIGSIGIVYGDIGTSPLYAFRESLKTAGSGGVPDQAAIIGVLSLVLWALFIIVTVKYVTLVLRADNDGQGGILSLMALAKQAVEHHPIARYTGAISLLGIAGAALFYGDAIITPAISVLSAMEGLEIASPAFAPYIMPLALCIITILFLFQRHGAGRVGNFFGPVMILWFLALAAGGAMHVLDSPVVWQAFNPLHGINFLLRHGMTALITLGAVFLSVTGAEALYADMGHFGRRPIRLAWLFFVMPSLMLNYLGQAALVLAHPEASANPFYLLYPQSCLWPILLLATAATIIASQAVITGAFSLTHQATQLGLLPRFHVQYTSEEHEGQIYLPKINTLLFAGVALLIPLFRTSSNLAAAYGIAVTGTMVITALLLFIIMRYLWRWSLPAALLVIAPFLLIDLTFLAANLTKLLDGGFVPLGMSIMLIIMMRTWEEGVAHLNRQLHHHHTMDQLMSELGHYPPKRVDGTAVYLTSSAHMAPTALVQNLKHNKILHEHNILLTIHCERRPFVTEEEQMTIEKLRNDFTRITMRYGFMQAPNVTRGILMLQKRGIKLDMMDTTFFISRRNIVTSPNFGMPLWRDRIFISMTRAASDAADYFHLPSSRVIELGAQMTV